MAEAITQTPRKIYLGDGAYVDFHEGLNQVKLTAEDGIMATNVVYLDANGMMQLIRWWRLLIDEGS